MVTSKLSEVGKPATDFTAPFEAWERGSSEGWSAAFRQAGLERAAAVGLPTTKDEDWRFTPLTPLAKLGFRPVLEPPSVWPTADALPAAHFSELEGHRLVFVDGHFCAQLSRLAPLPAGVELGAWSAREAAGAPEGLGQWVSTGENIFTALNAAYFTDGAYLRVGRGVRVELPIQLVHVSTATGPGSTAHTRHLIVAEPQSEATVIEVFLSLADSAHVTNAVTELVVGDDARLEHLKLQDENRAAVHLASLGGTFGRSSQTWLHSMALGGRLSRTNIRTRLAGEGLECVLNGLYLTGGDQLADHHMVVEHVEPHCASHEYFNGILDDRSRGVFHGRILVQRKAQKTDAKQTNKNILLSDAARADAKPQLEIYADDVKCTHGATIGQLDEESIFYLRSRGIGLETAKRMLIHAFAGEIIERVQSVPVRTELDRLVWDRLEQNPRIRAEVLAANNA